MDTYNNAVVLTDRTLRHGELFEVRLDEMVDERSGSIRIGVTTHSPLTLEFPPSMTHIDSGTWMMTGNEVTHNGTTVIIANGQDLDECTVSDTIVTL